MKWVCLFPHVSVHANVQGSSRMAVHHWRRGVPPPPLHLVNGTGNILSPRQPTPE